LSTIRPLRGENSPRSVYIVSKVYVASGSDSSRFDDGGMLLRDALQEGSADAVAFLPIPRVEVAVQFA
jgi:hypothetical protein